MSKIQFISHDVFPEDEYTKELVYLCLEGKYRIAYVRKKAKNGGLFWCVGSLAATRNGQKEYFPAFLQDSNFLEQDIKEFLEKRKWESGANLASASVFEKPRSMDEISNLANANDMPF